LTETTKALQALHTCQCVPQKRGTIHKNTFFCFAFSICFALTETR
jgi:hypothetical protein